MLPIFFKKYFTCAWVWFKKFTTKKCLLWSWWGDCLRWFWCQCFCYGKHYQKFMQDWFTLCLFNFINVKCFEWCWAPFTGNFIFETWKGLLELNFLAFCFCSSKDLQKYWMNKACSPCLIDQGTNYFHFANATL